MKKIMLGLVCVIGLTGCATLEKRIRKEAADGAIAFLDSKRPLYVDAICSGSKIAFDTLKQEVRDAIEKK